MNIIFLELTEDISFDPDAFEKMLDNLPDKESKKKKKIIKLSEPVECGVGKCKGWVITVESYQIFK